MGTFKTLAKVATATTWATVMYGKGAADRVAETLDNTDNETLRNLTTRTVKETGAAAKEVGHKHADYMVTKVDEAVDYVVDSVSDLWNDEPTKTTNHNNGGYGSFGK